MQNSTKEVSQTKDYKLILTLIKSHFEKDESKFRDICLKLILDCNSANDMDVADMITMYMHPDSPHIWGTNDVVTETDKIEKEVEDLLVEVTDKIKLLASLTSLTGKEEAEIKKRKLKVYLSGAIASDKNYVSKFTNAKIKVMDKGYSVLSPIETEESILKKGAKECMFASIELLRCADIMLLLDKDLTKSKGMQIEFSIAKYCNIPIIDDYEELKTLYI